LGDVRAALIGGMYGLIDENIDHRRVETTQAKARERRLSIARASKNELAKTSGQTMLDLWFANHSVDSQEVKVAGELGSKRTMLGRFQHLYRNLMNRRAHIDRVVKEGAPWTPAPSAWERAWSFDPVAWKWVEVDIDVSKSRFDPVLKRWVPKS
jgi:hypothetical protein